MRQRHQKTPSKGIVRYQRQETWSKKHVGALRDRLLRRRHSEKTPIRQHEHENKPPENEKSIRKQLKKK